LSLHSAITSTKPEYRRITFDIESDDTSFALQSFYVSTKPLVGDNFATIVVCGWSIEDQYIEGIPTWCEYIRLEGIALLQKVEINRPNNAYIIFGGVLNYLPPSLEEGALSFAKGNKPVEFQIDDMAVCVPE
jgi:hypothetical protein